MVMWANANQAVSEYDYLPHLVVAYDDVALERTFEPEEDYYEESRDGDDTDYCGECGNCLCCDCRCNDPDDEYDSERNW